MIEGMQKMGFSITHVYGLTETYGPATVCAKHPEWGRLPLAEQARLNARQGVRYHVEEGLSVMDPQTMRPVPADGETMRSEERRAGTEGNGLGAADARTEKRR